jgi:hypothetical protein
MFAHVLEILFAENIANEWYKNGSFPASNCEMLCRQELLTTPLLVV